MSRSSDLVSLYCMETPREMTTAALTESESLRAEGAVRVTMNIVCKTGLRQFEEKILAAF